MTGLTAKSTMQTMLRAGLYMKLTRWSDDALMATCGAPMKHAHICSPQAPSKLNTKNVINVVIFTILLMVNHVHTLRLIGTRPSTEELLGK